MPELVAPFPWFGGKRKIAPEIWARFGRVVNYVEPFFGGGAVLLGRPQPFDGSETINDIDGYIANFFRAIKHTPEETASHADRMVNENDLHAIHGWLLQRRDELPARLESDPNWFDEKIAGWWVWGLCCWIGGGFCSGQGPWHVVDGRLVNTKRNDKRGAWRQLPHLGNAGQGIHRQRPHLGDAGMGIGVNAHSADVYSWFAALSERFRRVRVCCGDWSRVCGPSVTYKHGLTAVFLDPPYGEEANRHNGLYRCDSLTLARDVRAWAIENGRRRDMRIALCGYEGEHVMPPDWDCVAWNAGEGFGGQAKQRSGNGRHERVWFSPACLKAAQMGFGF